MEKRFSQFDDLHSNLKNKYANLPKMPGKTLMKSNAPETLEKRRIELCSYIQAIVLRSDIRIESAFRDFLDLDVQIPNSICFSPLKIA
jgi:hypothetical protein